MVALVVCVVLCLFFLGKEVSSQLNGGESRNPNFGNSPARENSQKGHSTPAATGADASKDQYYKNLKFNRPDLSEEELKEKTDHWWKVKNGEAQATGG